MSLNGAFPISKAIEVIIYADLNLESLKENRDTLGDW